MYIRYIEFFSFFVLLPLLFFAKIISLKILIPVLWVVALYSLVILGISKQTIKWDKIKLLDIKYILIRFTFICMGLYLFTNYFYTEYLFKFATENFRFYFLVILLYPILSVIPQEIIFRKFFLYRFGNSFSNTTLIILNGVVFAFVHIVFGNYIAVIFSLFAGIFFMETYLKTKSLTLVCIEHALYGNMIFTIGLGKFFYHGGNI